MDFLDLYNSKVEQDKEKTIREKITQKLANGKPTSYPFLQVDVKAGDYKAGFHNFDNQSWILLCDNHIAIVDKSACEQAYQLAGKELKEIEQILMTKIIENLVNLEAMNPAEEKLDFVFNMTGAREYGSERIYADDVVVKIPKEKQTDELKKLLILFVAYFPKVLKVSTHNNTICFTSLRKSYHPEAK